MTPAIVIHYHEIALKGGNRDWFERKLVENIRWALRDVVGLEVRRMFGRVVVRHVTGNSDFSSSIMEGEIKRRWPATAADYLQRVFGIANILIGYEVRQEYAGLEEDVVRVVRQWVASRSTPSNSLCAEQGENQKTFCVRVKRGNKQYPLNSMELERKLGASINEATGLAVNLTKPDLTVSIEIIERTAFVFTVFRHFDQASQRARGEISSADQDLSAPEAHPPLAETLPSAFARDDGKEAIGKIAGPGGLPVGVSGRVVTLLSSGFDSPVAAWMMMKRGCITDFVHFHSYPYTTDASKRNVEDIVRMVQQWQCGRGILTMVPLIAYQKVVMTEAPAALRVLLYRRMMFRIAERVAQSRGCEALVTGENLGQVASQTIPNMAAVAEVVALPVFRPLLGFDKQEIIAMAERIGTADISKRPYDDCCSLFTPQHPATRATGTQLDSAEASLAVREWEDRLMTGVERVAL